MDVWYATREAVKAALDSAATARDNAQVDRAIGSASRGVDKLCKRPAGGFAPWTGTRYFDWPDLRRSRPWRLWLDQHTVITVTTLITGGVTIPATDYFLEPVNDGPPFDQVQIDLASSSAFAAGATHQRAIAITGVFGYDAAEVPAGALAEALDSSETAVDVSDSAAVGIGDLIRVDTERMRVTGKSMLTTGQTLQTPLTESMSNTTVAVTAGSAFHLDEVILLDAERMLVVDIAGNNLIVRRAWDGSALAAHAGSTIFAPRTLTVQRGAAGTTATTHSDAAAVARHDPPGLVRQLTIAEALNALGQEQSGYAREVRAGEAATDAGGGGLEDLRIRCRTAHGRRRMGVV